jgi:hypothetical protein
MANDFASNFTRPLMRVFLEQFESKRVLSKNVDTQLMAGKFNPASGTQVDVKRPTDYKSVRTATGDVSGSGKSDIITGKATATVQDYFTVHVDYDEADEAIKMDQLDQLLDPMTTRIVTDLEVDFADFMMKNTALTSGTVGTSATTWEHVADAGATLMANGIPQDSGWFYTVNPFTQATLANTQRAIGAVDPLVSEAFRKATIADMFAGMKVMTATTLSTYTTDAGADRAGTLTANPDVTYVTAKDTMTQTFAVTAFQANLPVKAGETFTITAASGAVNRLNLSTRQEIVDGVGAAIVWSGTVVSDVTLGASGEGNIVVSGPAIFESGGQYNTVSQAPLSGDVCTLLGAAATTIQPNLFWHKQAYTLASVPIKKLHSTDTVGTTEDGLQFRVSRGTNFLENQQLVRIDFRPAYGVMNPFFAGQSYG